MSKVLEAVRRVLIDAGQSLHYQEITRRCLAQGYWRTDAKTPEATISAQLAVNINTYGDKSPFRRAGRGIYELNPDVASTPSATSTPSGARRHRRAAEKSGKTLSFTDAAERVLRQAARRQPMHYCDITASALEQGLLNTSGLTPDATMYAQIIQENQRRSRRGERARFERYGKGMVGLTAWHSVSLAYQIEQHNREVRRKLRRELQKISPDAFEDLVDRLLAEIGFEEVQVTARQGDGGIDVRGTLVVGEVIRTRMAVQVKRWKNNVQAPTVQQVRGSLGAHEQGLIITTSDFSGGARTEAERPDATPVALMNGEQLISLLVENEIGVVKQSHALLELGESEEGHE